MTRRWTVFLGIAIVFSTTALSAQTSSTAGARQPLIRPRGFIGFGITQFLAVDTFEAIFGDARGSTWSAGGQVLLRRGFFAEVGVERFERTGQRVFVFEGTVIPLGIADTISITPITVIGGFRFREGRRVVPYVGGGIGSYAFREQSEFAEAEEDVDSRHTGFVFVAGSEFRILRLFSVAGELQLATVSDALGADGVSSEYGETNLGGRTLRVKLVVGR